jgi:hypothetical protein
MTHREKVFGEMKSKYPRLADFEDYLPEIAAFLGCNYIPRIFGTGVAKVLGTDKNKGKRKVPLIVQQYLEAIDKSAFLLDIEGKGAYNIKKELWRQLVGLTSFGKSYNFLVSHKDSNWYTADCVWLASSCRVQYEHFRSTSLGLH